MKTAIVTGGAGGIGRAIAAALAEAGYRVGIFDYDSENAERAAGSIANSVGIGVDVTSEESVAAAMEAFGACPDLLVNNAGISAPGGMCQPVATFRNIVEVNLVGPFIMCQAVAPGMADRGSGAIVNITSTASVTGVPMVGGYGPSKAALSNLTKALALEYAPRGIRVNAVAPGFINAGLGARSGADPALYASRVAQVPARALGDGDDIASAVLFLASDAARYIHGQEIVVDGALTLTAMVNVFNKAGN